MQRKRTWHMMALLTLLSVCSFSQTPKRLGLNFPFRSPDVGSIQYFLNLMQDAHPSYMRQMTFADVAWQQVEPGNNAWSFSQPDSCIKNALNMVPIPTLYGITAGENDVVGLQVPWRACSTAGCGWTAARDSLDSRDYVQTTVQRYKSYTPYWEISNEMNTKMKRPLGLPLVDFVAFMKMNYRWIKSIDNKAQVLLPGLLGTCGFPFTSSCGWLRDYLQAGGSSTFDIMNYHDYNAWWTLPAHYDSVVASLKKYGQSDRPIWVTECSISSDPGTSLTPSYASEDEQAADVWRRPACLFAKGAQVFIWHTLYSSGPGSEWRHFGILDPLGKRKKSFYSFRLLEEKIEGFQSAKYLSSGVTTDNNTSGGSGTWVVELSWPDGTRRWILWCPEGSAFTLSGLNRSQVLVTNVVPVSITTDGKAATVTSTTLAVSGGSVKLNLTAKPILVEEVAGSTAVEQETSFAAVQDPALLQNHPNPFNSQTMIVFELPHTQTVQLDLYDVLGRPQKNLLNLVMRSGRHRIPFSADGLASGEYWLLLRSDGLHKTIKMCVIK
jgi:hypothetical protein